MVVWDGGATDFGRLNGAGWCARLTLWIVCIRNVGRCPLHGVNHFRRRGVSWLRGSDFKSAEVDLMMPPHFMGWFLAEVPILLVLKRLNMVYL